MSWHDVVTIVVSTLIGWAFGWFGRGRFDRDLWAAAWDKSASKARRHDGDKAP